MIDAIKDFFNTAMLPAVEDETSTIDEDVRLAACALLLEVAYADDDFSDQERQHLESELGRRFGLEAKDTDRLLTLAQEEREDAVDLWQFTRLITEHSDGTLQDREVYFMRKICNLLRLEPGYLAQARQRFLGEE